MKIGNNVCSCGCDDFTLNRKKVENHLGIRCAECGKWLKWANKKEVKMFEQEDESEFRADMLNRLNDTLEPFGYWVGGYDFTDEDNPTLLLIKRIGG